MTNHDKPDGRAHEFGGNWTETKLEILRNYLNSYQTVMKNTPFQKIYIDAFAGTGYRVDSSTPDDKANVEFRLFPDDDCGKEKEQLLEGSARIALRTNPQFDRYIFIDKNDEHCKQLRDLKLQHPLLANRIAVCCGDANEVITDICNNADWKRNRAVMFLDPYGLQVNWSTIEAIAATRAVDLWVLFSCSAVTRMIPNNGDVPDAWALKLDAFFGTMEWRNELIKVKVQDDLFGDKRESREKEPVSVIGNFYLKRLKTVFAKVADKPRVLRNSRQCPMYLFCFAASNERGAPIALRIAGHLLRDLIKDSD